MLVKRPWLWVLGGAALVGLIVLIVVVNIIRREVTSLLGEGSGYVEAWVGKQLRAVAGEHLHPELMFSDLDFEYPYTVTLRDVVLRSTETNILETQRLRLTLAETPRAGQPIRIERIEIDRPTVRLLRDEAGRLIGYGDLVKSSEERAENTETPRLSEIFDIRLITLREGSIEYRESAFDEPMVLDDITLDLTADPDEAGWHALACTLEREHFFQLVLEGRLSLDDGLLDLPTALVRTALDPDAAHHLPPSLQAFVREYDMRGRVEMNLSGLFSLDDLAASRGELEIEVNAARFVFGDYVLPVETIDLRAALSERRVDIEYFIAGLLGGIVEVRGELGLDDDAPLWLMYEAAGLRVQEALRRTVEIPRYAGRVDFEGTVEGMLARAQETLDGQGALRLTEGRLMNLPIIGQLARMLNIRRETDGRDHGEARFRFDTQQLLLRELRVRSGLLAARGEGELAFDAAINFRLNAGPLERLQDSLGGFGELFGQLTDRLMTYRVRGTWTDPRIEVHPLGINPRW